MLAIVILGTAGLLAGTPPAVAQAIAACGDAGVVHRFAGFKTGSPQYGATAQIRDRAIALCSNAAGATSGASAWVMLAGGSTHEYAQAGFARIAGMPGALRFTEYNDGEDAAPNWNRSWWNGFSAGTNHAYTIAYSFSTGRITGTVDGQTLFTTPWSSDTEWHPGWNGQFMGETWDRGDDVPGTAAARTELRGMKAKPCRGCAYAEVGGISGSDLAAYRIAWVDQTSALNIWTQR
jgi:hypothetical protein